MEKPDNQAFTRSEKLWKIGDDKLLRANIIPSAVEDRGIYPVDYCISAITRLVQQPYGAEVVRGVGSALSELFETADTRFIYLDGPPHVFLLGCTQRRGTNVFEYTQVNKIKHICVKEVKKKEPAEITLKGIGIAGNQAFIQGFPQNRS